MDVLHRCFGDIYVKHRLYMTRIPPHFLVSWKHNLLIAKILDNIQYHHIYTVLPLYRYLHNPLALIIGHCTTFERTNNHYHDDDGSGNNPTILYTCASVYYFLVAPQWGFCYMENSSSLCEACSPFTIDSYFVCAVCYARKHHLIYNMEWMG